MPCDGSKLFLKANLVFAYSVTMVFSDIYQRMHLMVKTLLFKTKHIMPIVGALSSSTIPEEGTSWSKHCFKTW